VSPRGASDWWRASVRNSVAVHQHKIRGSAILVSTPKYSGTLSRRCVRCGWGVNLGMPNWNQVFN